MNLFEPTHLLILAIVVLVLFGAKKIPEFMRGVGQGVGELQKGLNDAKRTINTSMDSDSAAQKPVESTPLQTATPVQMPTNDTNRA